MLRDGDKCVFVSAYMASEEPAPPIILRELVSHCDINKLPLIIGTDANAHDLVWGSSDINERGEELLNFCASFNLEICNVGNKPTFRTQVREEVLDMTLVNPNAVGLISDWHVSDVPSLSDHMFLRFKVKSMIHKPKMYRNIRRTCLARYLNELEHQIEKNKLNV